MNPWVSALFFVSGMVTLGCGQATEPTTWSDDESELTTGNWPPSPPWEAAGADSPIDPRQVRMRLEDHAGLERVCDVSLLGQAETDHRNRVLRQMVRCVGETGAGWADLRFPAAAAELAAYVRVGERLKVRVRPAPGFEGHPAIDFLASMGPREVRERSERSPGVGTNWERVAALRDFDVHRCAVSYIGPIEPIAESDEIDGVSHKAMVSCNSRRGESWVEMAFPEVTQSAALRVIRGEVVAARLLESTGNAHPLVRYEGP